MRHGKSGRKLGEPAVTVKPCSAIWPLLIKHEQITTLPKAKELHPFVEKLVTLEKRRTERGRQASTYPDRNGRQVV